MTAKVSKAVLKARGSWRAKGRANEPTPPPGKPVCPRWLCRDAKAAWKQVVPLLADMGVLTPLDRNALARYCETWARWKAASAWIEEHGETYALRDDKGEVRCLQQFPQVGIVNQLGQQLSRLEKAFGLSPASRANIQIAPKPNANNDKKRFFPDNQAG